MIAFGLTYSAQRTDETTVELHRVKALGLIDRHAHWLPESLLALLAGREKPPFARVEAAGWSFTAVLRGKRLGAQASDLAVRADMLSAHGITRQILSLSPLWNIDSQPLEEALPLVQAFNDATAAAAAAAPMLYGGLAAVPADDVAAACRSTRELPSSVSKGLFCRPIFFPRARARTHGRRCSQWQRRAAYACSCTRVTSRPRWTQGRTTRTTRGIAAMDSGLSIRWALPMLTLCDTGWLATYPNVTVQFANLGGSYTFALERLAAMMERSADEDALRMTAMRNVVVDSASLGPAAIQCTRTLLGTSAVVFGTDMPMFNASHAIASWNSTETAVGSSYRCQRWNDSFAVSRRKLMVGR